MIFLVHMQTVLFIFAFSNKFYSFVFVYDLTLLTAKTHLYQHKVRLVLCADMRSINYELCM